MFRLFLFVWPALLAGQSAIPTIIGQPVVLLPPAIDAAGQRVAFGSAATADGAAFSTTDLYIATSDGSGLRRLTRLAGSQQPPQGASAVSLSADGARAAYTERLTGTTKITEEVHVIDVATGADRAVAVDTEGCIQPLESLCINCFFTCVNTPHITADGSKVVYSVRRQQPFFAVNADGTGLAHLPVFLGSLAPAPQRVVSRSGLLVFTSSAPSGPTFAASATDVQVINLDGTGLLNLTKFGNDFNLFTSNATISADGSVVAFESNRNPDTGKQDQVTRVWTVRGDGTGLRPLTAGDDPSTSPSISADGKVVAFAYKGQIFAAAPDGSGLRAVSSFQLSAAQEPVVSDDGSRVAFVIGPRNFDRGAIYSAGADGKNLRPVYAPKALNQRGVVAAAGTASPSPGSLFSAFGLNLTADTQATAGRFPLPDTLGGLSLLVNGRPAPLLAVTPWQVNAQMPTDVPEGPAAFQFRFADGSQPVAVAADVKAVAPAVFQVGPANALLPAVVHGDGTQIVDRDHPAEAGEGLAIYSTGLGLTDPFVPAGAPAPLSPLARTLFRATVQIDQSRPVVFFSGLTPGFAGLYQVNIIVPSGLRAGTHCLSIPGADGTGGACSVIWIK